MEAPPARSPGLSLVAWLLMAATAAAQGHPGTDDWAMRIAQAERARQNRVSGDLPARRPSSPPPVSLTPEADTPPIAPPAETAPETPVPAETPPPPAVPSTVPPVAPPLVTPPSTTPPPISAAAAPSPLAAAVEADRSLFGGEGRNDSPVMLGDQPPVGALRLFPRRAGAPPIPPVPPVPPVPPLPPGRPITAALSPSARGFKISENQSPKPQDRVFATMGYFSDINGAVNRQLGGYIQNMTVYRELFGIEKTFLDGFASLGLRQPLDTLVVNTPYQALGGTNTSLGNLTVFGKYILAMDDETGSLLSTGLSITTPTGPSRFAGHPAAAPIRDVLFQPFLGFIKNSASGRFYAQGFTAIDVPTDNRDVTLYYNDLGVGYYLVRNEDRTAFLTAVVPTFEVHINTPLNHRGAVNANDPFATPDIVNLTYGTNILLRRRALLSIGVVTPVTGPRPFDYEVLALFNLYFGRTVRNPAIPQVPLFGGP